MTVAQRTPAAPWWRVGMMWLVLGGPASVVVAGIATVFIAATVSDEVLPTGAAARKATAVPAVQARNHAATGGTPAAPAATEP